MLESIVQLVEKLQQDQKVLANKIIKLTEVCKNKFAKVENENVKKNLMQQEKCEALNEDIEGLKKEQVKLSDDVTHLEVERDHVNKKIDTIDDALETIKKEIGNLKGNIDEDNNVEKSNEDEKKQCKYDRKGYC